MPHGSRSLQDARDAFKACKNPQHYNQWAETYNTDHDMMDYMAPAHTAQTLMKHVRHSPDQSLVLDVACGSGLVAKMLSSLGFRHFVGVDGSAAMLEEARKTTLYQNVLLVLLGTQALPVDAEQFDVVTIVGALYPGFVPVKVVRELCHAAKPGGLVVLTRGNYQRPDHFSYTQDLHSELRSMEQEGLWKCLELRQVEHYLSDPHQPQGVIQGSVYIYQKC
ncbi:methyltransferase-like protein 27 [Periophthalmus magnuspinnatus]|uniref:methyltransferase-like protein 27 n=1 Tax=Periophthalmus magnuspinnatus TaxID=409849 RepID=UPI00145A345B|nr:methyltransferase-like protein 27 [Periophthalmus magnuspinnatus]